MSASYALWTSYNGGLGFYVWNDDEQVVAGRIGPSEIWDGRWHHVAGTFDGSRAQFFVDGRSIEGSTLPTSIDYDLLSSGDTGFGQYLGTCDLFFTGSIDEVMLFSQALPIQQIWQRWRWLLSAPSLRE